MSSRPLLVPLWHFNTEAAVREQEGLGRPSAAAKTCSSLDQSEARIPRHGQSEGRDVMSGLGIVLLAGRGASAAPKPSPCRPGVGRGAAQAGTALRCSKQPHQIYGQLFFLQTSKSHMQAFSFWMTSPAQATRPYSHLRLATSFYYRI